MIKNVSAFVFISTLVLFGVFFPISDGHSHTNSEALENASEISGLWKIDFRDSWGYYIKNSVLKIEQISGSSFLVQFLNYKAFIRGEHKIMQTDEYNYNADQDRFLKVLRSPDKVSIKYDASWWLALTSDGILFAFSSGLPPQQMIYKGSRIEE